MPSRSIVSGLLVAGMAVSGIHLASSAGRGASLAGAAAPEQRRPGRAVHAADPLEGSWSDRMDKTPEESGKLTAEKEFNGTLCDVISVPGKACPPEAGSMQNRPMFTDGDVAAPDVAFAIVPDPVHTHLALWFDRSMDALEEALQDSGWEYQTHWMPWPHGGSGAQSTKFKDNEQERLFLDGEEKYPGLIFFRPSSESNKNRPLIMLVIGDSPTTGINQTQFREAVRQLQRVAPTQKFLKIVGPNFTGSGPSLHALLAEEKAGYLADIQVDVASGSISNWKCGDILPMGVSEKGKNRCTDEKFVEFLGTGFKEEGKAVKRVPDTFVSFDTDFDWEAQQTESYLHEMGHLRYDEMALLQEDESGFGALGSPTKGTSGGEVLRLTFPRNISHLRSAYEKNGVWGFGASSGGSGSISLSLDFDESREGDDSVPIYAGKQMPVSQEATLGQVASLIEQRHIKAVLLSATDVLDELFVSQILARQAPNLMVVIRGTDDLFLRPGDRGVYHNMYAVASWPLIPRNYFWSQRTRTIAPRSFPSDRAEGFYTATSYLLRGDHPLKEMQDYSSPLSATKRPPLWFMAIGRGAYWPLALLPDAPMTRAGLPQKKELWRSEINLPPLDGIGAPDGLEREQQGAPLSQLLLLYLGFFFTLPHAMKCLDHPKFRDVGTRYRITERTARRPKLLLQAGISLLGILGFYLLSGPARLPDSKRDLWWFLPTLLGGWALALAASSSLTELFSPPEDPLREEPRFRRKLITSAFVLLGVCWGWFLLWGVLPASAPSSEGLKHFFNYRSQYPLAGASPVLPLLLAVIGLTLNLLSRLDRFTFGPGLRPRLPKNSAAIPNCPNDEGMEPLNRILNHEEFFGADQRQVKIPLFFLLFVVVAVAAWLIPLAPRMLEGRVVAAASGLAMLGVLLALLWDLSMAVYLWKRLKGLCLERLESSSLRFGFSRICGLDWKDLWLLPQSHLGMVQYRTMTRVMEQSTRSVLSDFAPTVLSERIETMRDTAKKREPFIKLAEEFGVVQDRLMDTADEVMKRLAACWQLKKQRITAGDAMGGEGTGKRCEEPEAKKEECPQAKLRTAWQEDIALLFPERALPPVVAAPEKADAQCDLQPVYEEWVALIYVHYIRMVLTQIRSRLLTAVALYCLLVLSVTCYPYLNRHVLIIALSVVFAIITITAVSTYADINRDPILSRTTENHPGKLDADFYIRTASVLGVPLIGLIASQFPEVSSFLFSWIEPGMAAFH